MRRTPLPRVGETKFDILAAVVDHCAQARFGPTVEELREKVGLSVRSSVQFHLNHLVEDGLLEHVPRKHRSLRPTDRGQRLVELLRDDAPVTG